MKLFFNGFSAGFVEWGHFIGNFVSTILLFIVFFFGIGLIAVYAKIMRISFLLMKPLPVNNSYWTDKAQRNKTKEDSLKPF